MADRSARCGALMAQSANQRLLSLPQSTSDAAEALLLLPSDVAKRGLDCLSFPAACADSVWDAVVETPEQLRKSWRSLKRNWIAYENQSPDEACVSWGQGLHDVTLIALPGAGPSRVLPSSQAPRFSYVTGNLDDVIPRTLRVPLAVGADVQTVRVRHFTTVSSLRSIEESGVILAGDRGSVFAVRARGKAGSPRDVEQALGIKRGRGGAFVEFEASTMEFVEEVNPLTGATEYVFRGNVDLAGRNPEYLRNR